MRARSKARRKPQKQQTYIVFALGIAIVVLFVVLSNNSKPKHTSLRQRTIQSISALSPPSPHHTSRLQDCQDLHTQCQEWQRQSQCTSNPEYMLVQCPQSCFGCQQLRTRPNATFRISTYHHGPLDMPSVGLGTAGLGEKTHGAVQTAVELGYRLVDTAAAREWYRQDLVGKALMSLAPNTIHDDIWITSKVHPRDLGFNKTLTAVDQILSELHRPYIHMVLLHYPRCWPELCGAEFSVTAAALEKRGESLPLEKRGESSRGAGEQHGWQGSWRALELLVRQRRVLAIGVSNFDMQDLVALYTMSIIKPSVVQRFADPLHPDTVVRRWCALRGVQYQAYSSLGTQEMMQGTMVNPVLTHDVLVGIAASTGWSVVQVVLRWALQTGQAVLPRSSNPQHLAENVRVLSLGDLSEEHLEAIDSLASF